MNTTTGGGTPRTRRLLSFLPLSKLFRAPVHTPARCQLGKRSVPRRCLYASQERGLTASILRQLLDRSNKESRGDKKYKKAPAKRNEWHHCHQSSKLVNILVDDDKGEPRGMCEKRERERWRLTFSTHLRICSRRGWVD